MPVRVRRSPKAFGNLKSITWDMEPMIVHPNMLLRQYFALLIFILTRRTFLKLPSTILKKFWESNVDAVEETKEPKMKFQPKPRVR